MLGHEFIFTVLLRWIYMGKATDSWKKSKMAGAGKAETDVRMPKSQVSMKLRWKLIPAETQYCNRFLS